MKLAEKTVGDHVVGVVLFSCTIAVLFTTVESQQFFKTQKDLYILSRAEQNATLRRERQECLEQMLAEWDTTPEDHCPRIWDTLMCWPPTPANTVNVQPCPSYINLFWRNANATRTCTENSTWWRPPHFNSSLQGWTNLTQCYFTEDQQPKIIRDHMGRIQTMYKIGYGVSLLSLIAAIMTMMFLRLLNCPRNILHTNLFLSFIFRATISLLRDNLFVDGLGLRKDVESVGSFNYFAESDGATHWECKLLLTVFQYVLACNYMWIFVEALYLHTLIFVAVFSENSSISLYILFGWASPLSFIIPWVIVRALFDDLYCWNVNGKQGLFWIIEGPLICTVILNFVFFLNIVRVLFTKLNTSHTPERRKYRKLAKSTLVLIPLFGIHYIVFVFLPYEVVTDLSPHVELVKLYFEMLFNSFEGFLVALLFCFLNGEVQAEIRKRYHRFLLRRGSFRPNSNWHSMSGTGYHHKHVVVSAHHSSPGIEAQTAPKEAAVNGTVGNGTKRTHSVELSPDLQKEAQLCLVLEEANGSTATSKEQSPSQVRKERHKQEDEADEDRDNAGEDGEGEEGEGLIVHATDCEM